jgi:hypothetical protein
MWHVIIFVFFIMYFLDHIGVINYINEIYGLDPYLFLKKKKVG